MKSFLINKNLSLYYRLRKKIGGRVAFIVASHLEKVITLFGREKPPRDDQKLMRHEEWIGELSKDILSPTKKEKTITFAEIDKLTYGDLDEEEFFSIQDRESISNKRKRTT